MNIKAIALEGIDLAGKSTFIENFNLEGKTKHVKLQYEIPKNLEEVNGYLETCKDQYEKALESSDGKTLLLDRFIISESAYSKDCRNYVSYPRVEKFIQNNKEMFEGIFFVFLLPSMKVIEERFDKRGDDYVKKEQLKNIRRKYFQIFDRLTKQGLIKGMIVEDLKW